MPKINMANIQSALGKVKDAAAPLQNKGHTENVPVDYIRLADRNIYNEGDSSETIKELADNIEACGLLHPITVNKIAPDNYQIISGERRFKAVTEYLHWKSIPCMVFDNLSAEAAQLKLCMANLAVREYTASQKYKFYLEVKDLLERMKASGEYKGGMQKGIAELLNVTERQVKKYYQLEKLPEEIQRDVLDGKISINKALETAQKSKDNQPDSDDSYTILKTFIDQLSETQREMILNGQIDINSIFQVNDVSILDTSKNEDTMQEPSEKGEPVPLLDASRNEDTIQEPSEKGEPVPLLKVSSNKQPRLQDGSVLIYNNGRFIPNKIQILEEHEEYTVFKVFAVKL